MKTKPYFEIFRALKTTRKTQRWLAGSSGLNESTVSLILNGRLVPNDSQVSAIAGVLGIDATILFS